MRSDFQGHRQVLFPLPAANSKPRRHHQKRRCHHQPPTGPLLWGLSHPKVGTQMVENPLCLPLKRGIDELDSAATSAREHTTTLQDDHLSGWQPQRMTTSKETLMTKLSTPRAAVLMGEGA